MTKKTKDSMQEKKEACEEKTEEQAKLQEKVIEVNVDYKDQYLRLVAEFDNARKRMEREKQEFVKFANEGLISELLNVIDHLELSIVAAQTNPQDTANLIKGVEMVLANAREILKRNGVEPIDAAGKDFDPNRHEILIQEPSEEKAGTILEEIQRGYMYHGRVLRTTKVKVASQKNDA